MSVFSSMWKKSAVVMAATVALCSFDSQGADNLVIDDMQLNKTYEVSDQYLYGTFEGTFTPTADMTLRVQFDKNTLCCEIWADATHKTPWPGMDYKPGSDFVNIEVIKGHPVYFYKDFIMNPFSVTLINVNQIDVQLKSVSLPSGSDLSISLTKFLDFEFNDVVRTGDAVLTCGDASATLGVTMLDGGVVARVELASTMMGWYESGKIKAGDKIALTINDVVSNGKPVGNDGKISVNYQAMGRPVSLVTTRNIANHPFLSYYLPTNPAAQLSLVFDGALMPLGNKSQTMTAYLQFGDVSQPDNSYHEVMAPVLSDDGKTVSIDLSGVLRTRNITNVEYNENDPSTWGFTVGFTAVKGADGQYAYSSENSSIGSFAYFMDYKEVNSQLTVDFTPGRNSVVRPGTEIEIYIVGLENIDYSGIQFQCGAQTYLLEKSCLTITEDPDDEEARLIQFTIPDIHNIADGDIIIMSFADLVCADGFDHSEQLTVSYVADGFVGVSEMDENAAARCIYTIEGCKVANVGTALPKGFYIIDGRKVMVK